MMEFIISFRTELIKIKNSFTLWLIVIGSAFIPVFFLLHHFYEWERYLPKPDENPWFEYFRKGFNGVHFILLPMLLALLIGLLLNIEHKSNTWKHIFVLPVSKTKIYFSKYLLLISLIILFYCLLLLFFFLGALILSLWKTEFNFLLFKPIYLYHSVQSGIVGFVVKSFISILGITAIHFWLSYRLKNLFINIGIGLAGVVLSITLYLGKSHSIIYFPYAFPAMMCNFVPDSQHFLSDFHINSIICFVAVSILSYIDFTKKFKG